MDLTSLAVLLRRRIGIILLTLGVALGVTAVGTWLATPVYQASAVLRLATSTSGSISSVDFEVGYAERLMNTYVELADSRPILDTLQRQFDLPRHPDVKAGIIAETELIVVEVSDTDPARAADIANALAEQLVIASQESSAGEQSASQILKEQIDEVALELDAARLQLANLAEASNDDPRVEETRRFVELRQDLYLSLLGQYELVRAREALQTNSLSVVEPATTPLSPATPRRMLNLLLGLVLGLAGGVGLAFVLESVDETIYTANQVEGVGNLVPLASIPTVPEEQRGRFPEPHTAVGAAYRRLRVNLIAQGANRRDRAVLITSAEPMEGKSTITANLAAAMSRQGFSVIAVDGDMRLPTLHHFFDLDNKVGLSDVLQGKRLVANAIRKDEKSGVRLLTSGPSPEDPDALLASNRLANIVAQLKELYDVVLIDSPAFLVVSDAASLVPLVDDVLLIVTAERSKRRAVRQVYEELQSSKARSIHFVFNRDGEPRKDNYYYAPRVT